MHDSAEQERRVEVWAAMADHFLDTETRHDIPLTAMCCVRAGLSTAEARDVWRYEVSPAVAFNVWDMLGEWAGWDRRWLVGRIEGIRASRGNRPGTCRWLRYRIRVHFLHGVGVSILRCVDALLAVGPVGGREQMAEDLAFLARHYFDFCPRGLASLGAGGRERIRSLYPAPFRHLMAPAMAPGEARLADRRVRAALEGMAMP